MARVLLVLMVLAAVGCREGSKQSSNGATLFGTTCVQCHGADGKGAAYARRWNVPDLTDPAVQARSDEELAATIKHGKGQMPPWGGAYRDDQIAALVAHVRTFKTR
jgi:mono/diheme cytochrome c family protein